MACTNTWFGIYYASDSPTITIGSILPANVAIGATAWYVLDAKGNTVASGTCSATATSITVATSGVWASGGTVGVGAYHFYSSYGLRGQFVYNLSAPSPSAPPWTATSGVFVVVDGLLYALTPSDQIVSLN